MMADQEISWKGRKRQKEGKNIITIKNISAKQRDHTERKKKQTTNTIKKKRKKDVLEKAIS